MTIQKILKKVMQGDYSIYIIVGLSLLLTWLFIFNHMTNHKFQNLEKIALWQHFMNNVVCFHPITMSCTSSHIVLAPM
jgi:hypothetical protein